MRRNAVLLVCVALIWLAADVLTKQHFEGTLALGQHLNGPIPGLFRFTLVHNMGAAWGIFSGSMVPLGIFSLAVCALILIYLLRLAPESSAVEALGLALVFSGGIGNAIDRFAQGYVVDFIDLTFMDFPVFNVADIGVTCGIALFMVAFIVFGTKRDKELEAQQGAKRPAAESAKGETAAGSAGIDEGKEAL